MSTPKKAMKDADKTAPEPVNDFKPIRRRTMKNKKEARPSKRDRQNKAAGLKKSNSKRHVVQIPVNGDLLRCFSTIRKAKNTLWRLSGSPEDRFSFPPDSQRPFFDADPERHTLRQRNKENTDRLLNRILADLLEVISSEAGLRAIEPMVYTFPYSPPMPDEASDIR